VDVVVDAREVDRRLVAVDAEDAGAADRLGGVPGGEQRLGGHAAVVQAVAAHPAGLDQHRVGAHLAGPGGDHQPARAGPDHAEVGPHRFGHDMSLPSIGATTGPADSRAAPRGKQMTTL
jgi:hypothetical protein